jgi:hypothetical protein
MTYWCLRAMDAKVSLKDHLLDAIVSSIYKHPIPRLCSLLYTFAYIKNLLKISGFRKGRGKLTYQEKRLPYSY